jgi:hypothetical protein
MAKVIEEIPTHRMGESKTRYEIANELIDNYKVLDLVISDLASYSEIANSLWDKGIIKKDNLDQVEILNLPFTHRSQIANRLSFVR